ncbi:MAG TPA: response regulator [Candidatus Accumulibacter phosphatis]|nr:MAG: Transcriptional regulatory protein FixJ [Candidatus Accumulibacter sp. SK-11]HAY27538.1 DNA-binding response regulator [Accumulibacter sp.]HCN69707.1 DNA-binding response regulator [Accumulibacter sp.]HRL76899.1 response regulator [Candidatus Accumulibacter phosphatis]HRQ96569.1 response regulator [Candidatus Accumulibacter phosphatis]
MSEAPLVHVVDDDDSLRTALLRLLGAAGYEARGYASAGDFLLQPLPDRPGCLLLDLNMPGGPSGLELQAALRRQGVALPVVFLTGYGDVASSVRALQTGAVDFLSKPVEGETLLKALQRALSRDARARQARAQAAELTARFASLSSRERQVFDRVVMGSLNKLIAFELAISERTVKALRAQVMHKLGAHSVADLGRLAERLRQLAKDG